MAASVLGLFADWDPLYCWEWPRARTKGGYGQLWVDGKVLYTHRLAFAESRGREPVGEVRHRCDNPPCCNPRCLLEGTHLQNMHDIRTRLRSRSMKLNWEKVAEIRAIYAAGGISQRALALQYGVSQRQICVILQNRAWPREAAP